MSGSEIKRAVALTVLNYLQLTEDEREPGIIIAEEEEVQDEVARVLESQGFARSYTWSDVLNCLEEGAATFLVIPEDCSPELIDTLIQFCESSGEISVAANSSTSPFHVTYDPQRSRLILVSPWKELRSSSITLYRHRGRPH